MGGGSSRYFHLRAGLGLASRGMNGGVGVSYYVGRFAKLSRCTSDHVSPVADAV